MNTTNLRRQADSWRRKNGRDGGVVVLYRGKVAGWVNELRDPQSWCPGAIALSSAGECWVASGGDDYNGASEWQQMRAPT